MSYDTRFACCVVRSADARSMSSMLYDVSTGLSSCVGCGALGCEPSRRDLQVRAASPAPASRAHDAQHRTHRKSCVCSFGVRSLQCGFLLVDDGRIVSLLSTYGTIVAKVTDHHLPDETGLPIRASHLRAACSAHHHRHPRPPPTANHRYHHRSGASGSVPAR